MNLALRRGFLFEFLKISQNHQIEKKQKNVVNIHKDQIKDDKDKIKLDEKNEVKNQEDASSKSNPNESKNDSADDTKNK